MRRHISVIWVKQETHFYTIDWLIVSGGFIFFFHSNPLAYLFGHHTFLSIPKGFSFWSTEAVHQNQASSLQTSYDG